MLTLPHGSGTTCLSPHILTGVSSRAWLYCRILSAFQMSVSMGVGGQCMETPDQSFPDAVSGWGKLSMCGLRSDRDHQGAVGEDWTLLRYPLDVSGLCRARVSTEQQLQREDRDHVQIPGLSTSPQPGRHIRYGLSHPLVLRGYWLLLF